MTSTHPSHPLAIAVGDTRPAEFRAALASVRQACELREFPDALAAAAWVHAAGACPELTVAAQQRPGEMATQQWAALRQAAPLAVWLELLGSWCEGEARSGEPRPDTARVYWHQAARLVHKGDGVTSGQGFFRGEKALVQDLRRPLLGRPATGSIWVGGGPPDAVETLARACQACGWEAQTGPAGTLVPPECAAALFDTATRGLETAPDWLPDLALQLAGRPLILVAGFPRWSAAQAALAAGAWAILSTPYLLSDLGAVLEHVLPAIGSRLTSG